MHVFFIKDNQLLEKYNEIWDKFSHTIKKGFDKEPVYKEKHLKTKIKSYEGKVITNFNDDKMLKDGSRCISPSVILIDSVFKMGKNYYPQVFLEECKYIKEKEVTRHITEDLGTSSDDSDESHEE